MATSRQREELSGRFYSLLGTNLRKEQIIEDRAVVLPSQRTIDHGSTWIRWVPDVRGCTTWQHDCRHWHWGRVLTMREYTLGRLEAGDSPEEIEDNVAALALRHGRGWRLSLVHCDATGLSDLQSVPMAGIWPVRAYEYGMAKRAKFLGPYIQEDKWFQSLVVRYVTETDHEQQGAGLEPGAPLFVQVDEGDK